VKDKLRLAVLVSGNGSNLQALIDASAAPDYPAQIAVVISNQPSAVALSRARDAGLPALAIEHGTFATREEFEGALLRALADYGVGLVCLAGFMRLLSPAFLRSFPGRIMNIHPSLLPSFPGLHATRKALMHGVKVTGCTVHFVDEGTDSGPIIVQAAVPVLPEDDESSLAARVLAEEHRIYPLAVRWFAEGAIEQEGRLVKVRAGPDWAGHSLRNPGGRLP
jgi:phosphoribosylglycinamide formyltransferase-1